MAGSVDQRVSQFKDFQKITPKASIDQSLKLPTLGKKPQIKINSSYSSSSNANFSNVFKLTKANFKTPR